MGYNHPVDDGRMGGAAERQYDPRMDQLGRVVASATRGPVDETTPTVALLDGLTNLGGYTADLAERLNRVATNFAGEEPPTSTLSETRPQLVPPVRAGGFMEELAMRANNIESHLGRIHDHLARLERLA